MKVLRVAVFCVLVIVGWGILSESKAATCAMVTTASTNATVCQNSGSQIKGYELLNTTQTISYLRLYNSAIAPTCSSATNFVRSIPIPPASAAGLVGGLVRDRPTPEPFWTGLSFCVTGGGSSTDNTNAAAGIYIGIDY